MSPRIAAIVERARQSALAFPVAVLVAGLMLAISETAYYGAESRLTRLVAMGSARLELLRVMRRVVEAESGQRGYILTGGEEYLAPYRSARQELGDAMQRLEQLYAQVGDAEAQRMRAAVAQQINARIAEIDEVLRLHNEGRHAAAMDVLRSGIGREHMVQLRESVDALVSYQNSRIAEGLSNVYDTLLLNRIGVAAMTAVSLLVLGMFLSQSRLLARQREERQAEMRAERDRLELQVRRRTEDLTELARHLQTAREDERARLARDLHDELGALLTAAKLDVARIRPKLQQSAPDLLPRLTHLTESLNSGIALKRRIIEDLRPSTLSSLGLCPALEILCTEFGERSGLAVSTALEAVPLGASAELTVFRLVQESLTNVAKYAQARHVDVSLEAEGAHAVVRVRDDGVGFDTAQPTRGSHGLMGMRFRIEAEAGELQVHSAPGQGTTIHARLPLRRTEAAAAEPAGALPASSTPAAPQGLPPWPRQS